MAKRMGGVPAGGKRGQSGAKAPATAPIQSGNEGHGQQMPYMQGTNKPLLNKGTKNSVLSHA